MEWIAKALCVCSLLFYAFQYSAAAPEEATVGHQIERRKLKEYVSHFLQDLGFQTLAFMIDSRSGLVDKDLLPLRFQAYQLEVGSVLCQLHPCENGGMCGFQKLESWITKEEMDKTGSVFMAILFGQERNKVLHLIRRAMPHISDDELEKFDRLGLEPLMDQLKLDRKTERVAAGLEMVGEFVMNEVGNIDGPRFDFDREAKHVHKMPEKSKLNLVFMIKTLEIVRELENVKDFGIKHFNRILRCDCPTGFRGLKCEICAHDDEPAMVYY